MSFKLYKWLGCQSTSIASRLVVIGSISLPNGKILCIVICLWPVLFFFCMSTASLHSKISGPTESCFMYHMVSYNVGGSISRNENWLLIKSTKVLHLYVVLKPCACRGAPLVCKPRTKESHVLSWKVCARVLQKLPSCKYLKRIHVSEQTSCCMNSV